MAGIPILATVFLTALPQAAHAVGPDQLCAVSEVTTYSPPLSDVAPPNGTTITVHGQLFCSSTANPTGSYTETTPPVMGATCLSLLSGASGARTFVWTNVVSTPSLFSYNRTVTRVNGNLQVEFLGSIISGTYTPDSAIEVVTLPEPDPAACSGSGIHTINGVGTLTIGIL